MPINLITCVVPYKNKLAIGRNNQLLLHIREDLMYFKRITTSLQSQNSLPTIVLMGRKTWFSIPSEYRPFKQRINFVLTNDTQLLKTSPKFDIKNVNDTSTVYFMTFPQFEALYLKNEYLNVFVIGGGKIYDMFLEQQDQLKPERVYLTEVYNYKFTQDIDNQPDSFMNHLDESYRLISISEKRYDIRNDVYFRFLQYRHYASHMSQEHKYLQLARDLLHKGSLRPDRTGVGTIGLLGCSLRFDISNGRIPLLTTKRIPFKAIVEELLFFCRGDTDASILDRKGVKIWNGNTTREFLDSRNLHHYRPGVMGPMYGFLWRNFGAKYSQAFADTSFIDRSKLGGFDQLSHVEHLLKTDPFSRRIYISNLHPEYSSQMVLEPCHIFFQLYVTEKNDKKYLSGYFTMRSSDSLAWSYNIVSYTLLLYILALKTNMEPLEIVYNSADCHIYRSHVLQLNEQLQRHPRPEPVVLLDPSIKNKDWSDIKYSDFGLVGYFPHPTIKMEMAV